MQNQNIDGIKKPKFSSRSLRGLASKTRVSLSVDGVIRGNKLPRNKLTRYQLQIAPSPSSSAKTMADRQSSPLGCARGEEGPQGIVAAKPQKIKTFRHLFYQKFPIAVTAILLLLAFGGGMWAALTTQKSAAGDPAPVASASISAPIVLAAAASFPTIDTTVTNDMLFNTPLEMLQNYFKSRMEANILAARKIQLAEFLRGRNSPLAAEADTIAEQEHWKFILAISFAESTLGQKCYYNNCSGIGGAQIKSYQSIKHWILDFNRLLDKRYKDQTLEEMCGVYVQPCNPNWLLATGQILVALEQQNIE